MGYAFSDLVHNHLGSPGKLKSGQCLSEAPGEEKSICSMNMAAMYWPKLRLCVPGNGMNVGYEVRLGISTERVLDQVGICKPKNMFRTPTTKWGACSRVKAHPQQESQLGVPIVNMPRLAVGFLHQSHDHIAESGKGAIDAACFLPSTDKTNTINKLENNLVEKQQRMSEEAL